MVHNLKPVYRCDITMENAILHLVEVAAEVQNNKYYLKLPSGYMTDRFIYFTYINILVTCVCASHVPLDGWESLYSWWYVL